MNVIEMKSLTKTFGNARGIEDVTLTVKEGEVYGFIGPNGAGKSTTIKLLLSLIYPTNGSGKIFNQDMITQSLEIKKMIGYVPSEVRYYPYLTGEELIKTTLAFHHRKDFSQIDMLCKMLDIDQKKKIGALSLGNKKKIAIACALIHQPKLIILDEPTSGLDPLIQKRLFELLKERNNSGATIFISSHNLNEVQEHCTKVAFIKEGKILKVQELGEEIIPSKIVTIKGAHLQKAVFEKIGANILEIENHYIKFCYKGDISKLTELIGTLKPSDLTIENSSLEDAFLAYYEGGK